MGKIKEKEIEYAEEKLFYLHDYTQSDQVKVFDELIKTLSKDPDSIGINLTEQNIKQMIGFVRYLKLANESISINDPDRIVNKDAVLNSILFNGFAYIEKAIQKRFGKEKEMGNLLEYFSLSEDACKSYIEFVKKLSFRGHLFSVVSCKPRESEVNADNDENKTLQYTLFDKV